MELTHHGTNIILVGVPDHVFEWSDGTVSPIDYKTARYSKGQDALKPLYEAQLDAYAYLLSEKCNLECDSAALVYFEPSAPDTATITEDGYIQPRQVHVSPIEVSGQKTLDLLDYAREIYENRTAPDGRAECADCDLLDKLSSVVMRENTSRDQQLRFMNQKERAIYAATERFKRLNLKNADSTASTAPIQGSSILMNWDWSN